MDQLNSCPDSTMSPVDTEILRFAQDDMVEERRVTRGWSTG